MAATIAIAAPAPAFSQTTLDWLLGTVSVTSARACHSIEIHLNRPASQLSHFPGEGGDSLVVRLEPLAVSLPGDSNLTRKESASVDPANPAHLVAVSLDPFATNGPEVLLAFSKQVAFRVRMEKDSQLIHVDSSSPGDAARCLGKEEPSTDASTKSDSQQPPANDATGALKEGKSLLSAGDPKRAVLFFTKAVSNGSGAVKQEAQEMLGLARERAEQLAHARAEYEIYLKQYPKGAGAARVRARLDAVVAAMDDAAQKQFATKLTARGAAAPQMAGGKGDGQTLAPPAADANGGSLATTRPGIVVTNQGTKTNFKEPEKDPNAWTWEKNGSIAQYYYRDDNFSPSDVSNGLLDRHETFQNEFISSGDIFVTGENQNYKVELRSSMYNEFGLGTQNDIRNTNVGTLYAEGLDKNSGASLRLGRQSKSTGGVFGRFDGGVAGWKLNKQVKLQAYAGSPVYSRAAKPFADGRLMYGASIDYTFPNDELSTSLYIMEQDIKKIVDRRAIGMDVRYANNRMFAYASADYDIFYKQLNLAYASATWNYSVGNSVYATADFRRVPFLLTSNALMGQSVERLQSLAEIFGEDEIDQLALDRTATARTLSVGTSRTLNENWQLSLDATIADYSGTPASGGVDEIPDPGVEFYASAQLTGTNLATENDVATLGLRYSNSETSDMYMVDAFYRYPYSEKLRLNPRLRLSYRDFSGQDRVQYLVMPSLQARYRVAKQWNLELEMGARWEDIIMNGDGMQSLDFLATAGYRYDF